VNYWARFQFLASDCSTDLNSDPKRFAKHEIQLFLQFRCGLLQNLHHYGVLQSVRCVFSLDKEQVLYQRSDKYYRIAR
jgi:hypothetical protein